MLSLKSKVSNSTINMWKCYPSRKQHVNMLLYTLIVRPRQAITITGSANKTFHNSEKHRNICIICIGLTQYNALTRLCERWVFACMWLGEWEGGRHRLPKKCISTGELKVWLCWCLPLHWTIQALRWLLLKKSTVFRSTYLASNVFSKKKKIYHSS